MSVILIHNTLQTTFSLSDAVINEAPWQCASLQHQHDRLFQLINFAKIIKFYKMHLVVTSKNDSWPRLIWSTL